MSIALLQGRGFRDRARLGLPISVSDEALAGMTIISANTTYFVRTDGNDANTGLVDSSAGAFLTINACLKYISNNLCISFGSTVTVQIRTGTFVENVVVLPYVGGGNLTIQGDTSNQDNVVIAPASGNLFSVGANAVCTVKFLKLASTVPASSAENLRAFRGGVITQSDMTFGACADAHIQAQDHGIVFVGTGNKCIGNATYFMYALQSGEIYAVSGAVNISTTITISNVFCAAFYLSLVVADSMTFTNPTNVTGVRYGSRQNSVISCGGTSNFFPGSVAGATATGGQYV